MSLLELQRDFKTWLTTESPEAAAGIETGGTGLSVYLNNYRAALMACLVESFPATHAWLGDDAFAAVSAHHIERLPPHSWTLDAYALDVPATLALCYPDDAEVVELARLEMALGVAFVGADADPIDPARLAEVDWDTARLAFVPTLATMLVTTNAAAIWSALSADETPQPAEAFAEPVCIAVWRSGFTPCFRSLDSHEDDALGLMRGGLTFGELCTRLVARHGENDGPSMAGAQLGRWLQDGIITAIVSPSASD